MCNTPEVRCSSSSVLTSVDIKTDHLHASIRTSDNTKAHRETDMSVDGVSEAQTDAVPRQRTQERLSIPFALRLPLAFSIAGVSGFCLGAVHGASEQGLRFRAENAHRFPTTQTGWYLYHKSKNYHMALGGVKEGLKMSVKQGVWVSVYFGLEECVDRGRAGLVRRWRLVAGNGDDTNIAITPAGHRDFLSSVLAGLGTAGAFSAWHRFPLPTAARLARIGLKVGFAFGSLQDVLSLIRGRRLGYVEFIKRHTFWPEDDGDITTIPAPG